MMIIVDDIESMQPRKTASILPNPSRCPRVIPTTVMPLMTVIAVMIALLPTRDSFTNENSSPRPNIRNTMPIVDQVWMLSVSTTVGSNVKCGLIRKPAVIYPSTVGRCSFLNRIDTIAEAPMIKARSMIKVSRCTEYPFVTR